MPRSERPSIEELRALLMLAETGSVSAAAKRLGVKQPVVSNRLRAFRGADPLLRTRRNHVEFTDKGQTILPAVRDFMRQYDHFKQFLAGKRDAPRTLRLATGSSASQYYLARAIARVRKQLPDWEIETQVARGEDRILGTTDGEFDLAIVSHDPLQIETLAASARKLPALQVSELARQPLCVIARKGSPEADELAAVLAGHEVPVSALCRWKIIGLDRRSGVRRQIEQRFAASKQRPHFSGEAGGWLAVKEYARHELGVGLVPLALLSREDTEVFVIRRLASEVFIGYWLIHRPVSDSVGVTEMQAALMDAARIHQQEVDRRWAKHL